MKLNILAVLLYAHAFALPEDAYELKYREKEENYDNLKKFATQLESADLESNLERKPERNPLKRVDLERVDVEFVDLVKRRGGGGGGHGGGGGGGGGHAGGSSSHGSGSSGSSHGSGSSSGTKGGEGSGSSGTKGGEGSGSSGSGSGSSGSSGSGSSGRGGSSGGSSRGTTQYGGSYAPSGKGGKGYGKNSPKDQSTQAQPPAPPPYTPNASPGHAPPAYYSHPNYGARGTTPRYWNGQYFPYRSYGYGSMMPFGLGLAAPFLLAGPFGFYGPYGHSSGGGGGGHRRENSTTNSFYINGTRNSNGDLVNGTFYSIAWEDGSYWISNATNVTGYNFTTLEDRPNVAVNGTVGPNTKLTTQRLNPNQTANGTTIEVNAESSNAGSVVRTNVALGFGALFASLLLI